MAWSPETIVSFRYLAMSEAVVSDDVGTVPPSRPTRSRSLRCPNAWKATPGHLARFSAASGDIDIDRETRPDLVLSE